MKKNVLVFPCGSEIALEVHRALRFSTHFNLIGASSVSDHGRFVFEHYIGGVPFVNDANFIPAMQKIVAENKIDFIYPAMDSVIFALKSNEAQLGCRVISSPAETTEIALSKLKTYHALSGVVLTPKIFVENEVSNFPVFCKPEIGYGSRGAKKIENKLALTEHLKTFPNSLILEYLPGEEFTVDCFTDKKGALVFCGARKRARIMNGISVNTLPIKDDSLFKLFAEKINSKLQFEGAWFFQVKKNKENELTLLEIATRFAGSSALFRAKGINFAQLSLFTAMGYDVNIMENQCNIEMDRALDNKFKIDLDFSEVFIDYDDTIIVDEKFYNPDAMKFLFECKNRGIKITLFSRHKGDLNERFMHFKIKDLFDRIIHIARDDEKWKFIDNKKSIFIDDSFAERKNVFDATKIPVFGLDMIGGLF